MVISLASPELPSLITLANPAGADGAVAGMAGPVDEKPGGENMLQSMKAGSYAAIAPGGGACGIRVEQVSPGSQPLSLPGETLESSGLTEATLAKFNQPAWRAIIQMEAPGKEVRETVVFATQLAKRLAALADGIVMDTSAWRFFGPTGWPVENPIGEFDAREHVHLHIEAESRWFHTHGLIKFGRPEMEIYDVPPELDQVAFTTLLDISQYVITSALIQPGQTCGNETQPFYARAGKQNSAHWKGVPVLELVDLDDRGKPVSSGAPKALRLSAAAD